MVENLSCVVQHSSQQHPQSHPILWHWVEADNQIPRTVAWKRRCGTACGNHPQWEGSGISLQRARATSQGPDRARGRSAPVLPKLLAPESTDADVLSRVSGFHPPTLALHPHRAQDIPHSEVSGQTPSVTTPKIGGNP